MDFIHGVDVLLCPNWMYCIIYAITKKELVAKQRLRLLSQMRHTCDTKLMDGHDTMSDAEKETNACHIYIRVCFIIIFL